MQLCPSTYSGGGSGDGFLKKRRSGSGFSTGGNSFNNPSLGRLFSKELINPNRGRSRSGDLNASCDSLSLEEVLSSAAANAASSHDDQSSPLTHLFCRRRKFPISFPPSPSRTEKKRSTSADEGSLGHGSRESLGLSAATAVAQLFSLGDGGGNKKGQQQQAPADSRRSSIFNRSGDISIPEDSVVAYQDSEHRHDDSCSDEDQDSEEEGSIIEIEKSRLRDVKQKINDMRSEHDSEMRGRDLMIESLQSENSSLRDRLGNLVSEANDRHTVSEYAKLVTESVPRPQVIDSTNILMLQSQLCRALHTLVILENQDELQESAESDRVKYLQSELAKRGDESFLTEMEHMKDLLTMGREMERKTMESNKKLEERENELEKMRTELEREKEEHRRTSEALAVWRSALQ